MTEWQLCLFCQLGTLHCHQDGDLEDGTRAHHQQSEGNELLGSLSGGKISAPAFPAHSAGNSYLLEFHIPPNPGSSREV